MVADLFLKEVAMAKAAANSKLSELRRELDIMRGRGTVVTAALVREIAGTFDLGPISDQLAEELAKPPPAVPDPRGGGDSMSSGWGEDPRPGFGRRGGI